jgi:hypothetical protein
MTDATTQSHTAHGAPFPHHADAMQLSRYTPPGPASADRGLRQEPSTRSVRLWFLPQTSERLVETTGLEPVTFSVQGRRSPN